MITSFTDVLPGLRSEKDGKIHANFNQMGEEEHNVKTGRFSSTKPNLQQIPAKEKVMRMMFVASEEFNYIESEDNFFIVNKSDDLKTATGWIRSKLVNAGDCIIINDYEDNEYKVTITDIQNLDNNNLKIYFSGGNYEI